MKLINVVYKEETPYAIYCDVTFKTFWTGKTKTAEILLEKTDYGFRNYPKYANNGNLFGFETFLGINVANDICDAVSLEMARQYERHQNN